MKQSASITTYLKCYNFFYFFKFQFETLLLKIFLRYHTIKKNFYKKASFINVVANNNVNVDNLNIK